MNKKRCFTLVELLGVLSIVGILIVGTAVGVNTLWQNNRIDICESELRDFTVGFKNYFTDYKNIQIPSDTNYESVAESIVELLNDKYLSCDLEISDIAPDKRSMTLTTAVKKDPWNSKYQFNIYTYSGVDATAKTGLVIIRSNGPDTQSSIDTYTDDNYGDDIIAIIEPKN